ncbi:hypothetical protein GCM10010921_12060 [Microbacterium album]|uniref:HTH tetR-type domain-containing protein n=1 Tax=Microbacterium album TaxID=2053191 RepID=A0A917IF43_9MICO|nr:hypothetical protein GCM10010921_12060 [Microbacterium album]
MLSADPSAPLGEVATRAGVSRSTLHRYFPERRALTLAIGSFTVESYQEAFVVARTEDGTGLEAFRRLCLELMERLDVLAWWMGPGLSAAGEDDGTAADVPGPSDDDDERLHRLVARGREDASIDPQLSAEWVENLMWATLYAAQHLPPTTMPAHDVRSQALRSLLKAVAADPAAV